MTVTCTKHIVGGKLDRSIELAVGFNNCHIGNPSGTVAEYFVVCLYTNRRGVFMIFRRADDVVKYLSRVTETNENYIHIVRNPYQMRWYISYVVIYVCIIITRIRCYVTFYESVASQRVG